MRFWNEVETNIYRQLLQEQLVGSDYFYVTDDISIADYVLEPYVEVVHVDKVDEKNHKMQVSLTLNVQNLHNSEFTPLTDQQNHFILFAADNDEQQVADTLICKLLTRSAISMAKKVDKQLSDILEKQKRQSD